MAKATYWKYIGHVKLPDDISSGISNEWEATLKAEVGRIYTALTTKIPDNTAFQDKIADASSDIYEAFGAGIPAPWDKDEILMKQRTKLAASYAQWKSSVDGVFGGATPTFPNTVTVKKPKLKQLRRVIAGVGHKALGTWEPISMAVLAMRGDKRILRYIDSNDIWTNQTNLHTVVKTREGALISPSLIAEMVYACVLARYLYDAGKSADIAAFLAARNTVIDAFIQVALDATHKGVDYDFTIVLSWNTDNNMVTVTAHDEHPA